MQWHTSPGQRISENNSGLSPRWSALWLWEQQVNTFTLLYKQLRPAVPPTLFFFSHFCTGKQWVLNILPHFWEKNYIVVDRLVCIYLSLACISEYSNRNIFYFLVRRWKTVNMSCYCIIEASEAWVGKSLIMSHPSGWRGVRFLFVFAVSLFTDPKHHE